VLIIDLLIIKDANFTSYWYFERFYYYPFFIGISLLTYWLGLEGYKRKDVTVLNDRKNISPEELSQLEELARALHASMSENRWYRDPELTLNKLAGHIGVKPYLLTRALNTIMKTKFSDYVNELRVKEVRRMVNNPENDKYTLLSLALDSGFNSKSSFNRAVKKHLGIAPSELKSD
jgi:AraC-like DNA-binding protein